MTKFSFLLSLISAWFNEHSSNRTLTKSNITRRSMPRWMSKFRSPMSKSTTHVLWPFLARPNAKDAADVVFPTPPLPLVIHTILPLDGFVGVSTVDGWERTNDEDEEGDKDGDEDEKHC
mmetsp:Transcript_6872/g.8572  ORF Transcript_6872/g.8572 Transcript_6872/m.8572 type:complete len:119 (-) Transcript_6872:184-540(-)